MDKRPAHRPPIYTTPARSTSITLPDELLELVKADGPLSATITRILAAHYNIDPYVNAR